MTENEELKAILGAMLLEYFPERTREIIKSLRIIIHEVCENLKKTPVKSAEKEIMEGIMYSLLFMALNANVDFSL